MSATAPWERPSPRVAELIRTGAELVLQQPDDIFDEVDAVVLGDAAGTAVAQDPALADAVRRTNRANLVHWAEANLRDPGAPVEPNVGPATLAVARDLVRRGLDDGALDSYRMGQNVAWRRWMEMAFLLTQDPDELRELLDVSARSIFSFVDQTLAGIQTQIARERDQLTRGTHAQRLEVVSLLLEGAPIDVDRASARLNHALDRAQTAAIVWSDLAGVDPGALEGVAEALGRAAGARPLTVLASASARWVWVPGADGPDPAAVQEALDAAPDVRVALGPTLSGLEGFRRSHLDALATQRLMHRTPARLRLARYEDVQVVALATQDEDRADEFVTRTLGDLRTAPADLRETVRAYLREGSNATQTAKVLFTHRNTVLGRLARAEELLPAPIEGRTLQVALALEILHWRG
ncbi:MAG TPA: PucR family transcriptional regulator [Solirubrobacteraceae bacterium]|nr:PucR family transcriptional regulator [Solirubrobacteraceae bacterium]